jgi:hypothetical protein
MSAKVNAGGGAAAFKLLGPHDQPSTIPAVIGETVAPPAE